eukprot:m.17351 g.17351  ORF g.17351 m.17351 type:complete len:626 (+) comp27454_c0_seq1:69-1946(+)
MEGKSPPAKLLSADVIIVGLGPVGAVAANLLGKYGVRTIVFEKEQEIYTGPRAVAIDAETMRIFGMFDMDTWMDNHVSKVGYQLFTQQRRKGGVAVVDLKEMKKEYGYTKLAYFFQPSAEAVMRKNLSKFPNVQVLLGYEVSNIGEGEGGTVGVRAKYIGGLKEEVYTAKYLLGCDGGRSIVRRKLRLRYIGLAEMERWLVLDVHTKDEQIARDWPHFTYVFDGVRPFLHVPLPENFHRFEFLLRDNEDAEEMTKLENVADMLDTVGIDSSKLKFCRRIVYKFHSRQVERWNVGQSFLLGDAAHCLPPFRGQGSTGMCSGIRDAANLCWKIALILGVPFDASHVDPSSASSQSEKISILDDIMHLQTATGLDRLIGSYELERSRHVQEMIDHALFYGMSTKYRNPVAIYVRNLIFQAMVWMPKTRAYLEDDKGKPDATIISGFIDNRSSGAGELFPQPFVRKLDKVVLLDKVLGPGFAALGWNTNPKLFIGTAMQLLLKRIGCAFITVLPKGSKVEADEGPGYFSDETQCIVDEYQQLEAWFASHQAELVLLRPDRFVFGHVDGSLESGGTLITNLSDLISGKSELTIRKKKRMLSAWQSLTLMWVATLLVIGGSILLILFVLVF